MKIRLSETPLRRLARCLAVAAVAVLPAGVARAQAVVETPPAAVDTAAAGSAAPADAAAPSAGMSFALPVFDFAAPPSPGLPCNGWRLHEGFNAQLGMSLSVGLGRHAPRGVGFGQSAAFAYALPLSRRFSAAVGVYADHLDWGRYRMTGAGVAAAVRFEATERFSLYAYGARSFTPQSDRLRAAVWGPFAPMPKERVGVAGELKIGESAMISVSVERQGY